MIWSAALAGLIAGSAAGAAEISVLLESDADRAGGDELFLLSFASVDDLESDTRLGGAFLPQDIAASFSTGAAFYDGDYHILLESDADRAGGDELFLLSFDTFGDISSDTRLGGAFLPQDIAASFSVGAAFYDGDYHFLLESDADRAGGDELFLLSFDTFGDIASDTRLGGAFLPQDIAASFSVGAAFYDGDYHILLESDADRAGGDELFLLSFDTFGDISSDTRLGGAFLPQDIAASFSVGASFAQFDETDGEGPAPVPLPATLPLLLLGLGAIRVARRL